MITSLLCDSIDAVVALSKAVLEPATKVYDGPEYNGDLLASFVVIGVQGPLDPTLDWIASAASQNWSQLGAYTKDETTTIYGVSTAWNTDLDVPAARRAAMASVKAIEVAMRTPPNIRLGLDPVLWADIDVMQLVQASSAQGVIATITFAIRYTARLSGV
jgi:hypothetical protein